MNLQEKIAEIFSVDTKDVTITNYNDFDEISINNYRYRWEGGHYYADIDLKIKVTKINNQYKFELTSAITTDENFWSVCYNESKSDLDKQSKFDIDEFIDKYNSDWVIYNGKENYVNRIIEDEITELELLYNSQDSEELEYLQDFIYWIKDDSYNLSVDDDEDFFKDNSEESFSNGDSLTIYIKSDPIIKIEKTLKDNQKSYKFIVDITNKHGENFRYSGLFYDEDSLIHLLKTTVDALENYGDFEQYLDDLIDYCNDHF